MKTIFIIVCLLWFVSCSSIPKTGIKKEDALVEHMFQEPRLMGQDWDEKFTKDGLINGEYVSIGSAIGRHLNYNNKPVRLSAETDAMTRLLRSAPTDFKRIVQKAVDSVSDNDGSSTETMVSVSEVKALTGMTSNFDDIQCVNHAYPLDNGKWDFRKECRLILRIDAMKLKEAYDYTLSQKYSIEQKKKIDEIVNNELSNKNNGLNKVSTNP